MKRHVIFATLLAVALYQMVNSESGVQLISGRYAGSSSRFGFDLYVLCAWCAVYWRGPHADSIWSPYPLREIAVVAGVVGMIAWLAVRSELF